MQRKLHLQHNLLRIRQMNPSKVCTLIQTIPTDIEC